LEHRKGRGKKKEAYLIHASLVQRQKLVDGSNGFEISDDLADHDQVSKLERREGDYVVSQEYRYL